MTNLSAFIRTRECASKALISAFCGLPGKDFSEVSLRDAWLVELRKNETLYPDGWYQPPPHGLSVLIGKPDNNFARTSQSSFRPDFMWPSADITYDPDNDILSLYASPVDRASGVIGDFGFSLYRGRDEKIRAHADKVKYLTQKIADHAQVGMSFADLYAYAQRLFRENDYSNAIASVTDPAGTNIGHTVPYATAGDFTDMIVTLRQERVFVSALSDFVIPPDIAFTLEPRLSNPASGLPALWFHTGVVFAGGEKTICREYEEF